MQRFALPGRGLGEIYRAARATSRAATFFLRQRPNGYTLRESLRYIGVQSSNGYDISPGTEWLLDNIWSS